MLHTVSVGDLDREASWEVAAVERAIKRYQAAALVRDPAELPPGRRVLAETVGPVSARIHEMQDGVISGTAGAGRPPVWHPAFVAFDADVLAFVAVATALRSAPVAASRVGSTIPVYSRKVCAVLRDQADHDRFVAEQKEAAKNAPKGGPADAPKPDALLRRWKAIHPQADRRAWGRFSSRIEGARSSPWDEQTRVGMGGALAEALAAAAPEWFELERIGAGPAHLAAQHILMTPYAVERMADVASRAEVARPLLLPMLVPPNPWRYTEKEAA